MASASMATASSANNLISNDNSPYLNFNTSDPTDYTIINSGTLVIPHRQLLVTAPHSSEELTEAARRAYGLLLRAEAEKAPHIHYSSSSTASIDSNIKSNDSDSDGNDSSKKIKLASSFTGSYSSNSLFADDGTPIKQELPSPISSPRLLNSAAQQLRSIRKQHRRNRTHHQSTTTSPKSTDITHIRHKGRVSSVDNKSQTRGEEAPRTQVTSRPRLLIRIGYKKEFLAGPPEKTEADDQRIFYQRKLVCWRA